VIFGVLSVKHQRKILLKEVKKIFFGIFNVKHQGKIVLKKAKEKIFFGIFSVKHQRKILQILSENTVRKFYKA
jgi:hypothetical protein